MTLQDTQFLFQGEPSANSIGGFYTTYLNGKEIVSRTAFSNSIGSLSHQNLNDKERNKLRLIIELTSLTTDKIFMRSSVLLHSSHTFLANVTRTETTLGTFTVDCYFGWSDREGPPTYLEELHKLDNFSPSQYFPKSR